MTNGYKHKFEEARNLQPFINSVLHSPITHNKFTSSIAPISLRIINQEKQKKNTEPTKGKGVINRPNHNMNNKQENSQSIITSKFNRPAKVLSDVKNAKNGAKGNSFKFRNHAEPVLSLITNGKTVDMQKSIIDNIRSRSSYRSRFPTVKAFSAGKTPNAKRESVYGITSNSFRPKSLDERNLSQATYGNTAHARIVLRSKPYGIKSNSFRPKSLDERNLSQATYGNTAHTRIFLRSKSSNYARYKIGDNRQSMLPMIASKPLALITKKHS